MWVRLGQNILSTAPRAGRLLVYNRWKGWVDGIALLSITWIIREFGRIRSRYVGGGGH